MARSMARCGSAGCGLDFDFAHRRHRGYAFGGVEWARYSGSDGTGTVVAARLDGLGAAARLLPMGVTGRFLAASARATIDGNGRLGCRCGAGAGSASGSGAVPRDQYGLGFGRARLVFRRPWRLGLRLLRRRIRSLAVALGGGNMSSIEPRPFSFGSGLGRSCRSGVSAALPGPVSVLRRATGLAAAAAAGSCPILAMTASLASCSTWRMQSSSCRRWVVMSRAARGGLIARSWPTRAARAFS